MDRYSIVIEKTGNGFSSYSPDLPGCVATGRTRDQATRNMYSAIDMHVRGLIKDNLSILKLFSHYLS